jgi:hypothetical protein
MGVDGEGSQGTGAAEEKSTTHCKAAVESIAIVPGGMEHAPIKRAELARDPLSVLSEADVRVGETTVPPEPELHLTGALGALSPWLNLLHPVVAVFFGAIVLVSTLLALLSITDVELPGLLAAWVGISGEVVGGFLLVVAWLVGLLLVIPLFCGGLEEMERSFAEFERAKEKLVAMEQGPPVGIAC